LSAFVFLVTAVALTPACARPSSAGGGQNANAWPAGREFWSTAVTENGGDRPLAARITLRFRDNPEISADGGCNQIGITGHLDGDRFVATGFLSTNVACDQPRMDQDSWLVEFFQAGPTWQVSGDRLLLTTATTEIRLVDRRTLDPDRPLVGTRWMITGVFDRNTAASYPAGPAYVTFDTDGTVIATSGCETLAGPATVDGHMVTFGRLDRTALPCPSGPAQSLDAAVTATLHGTVTFQISSRNLTLTTVDGSGLTLTAQ
jgi:heat shock protein HslJ